MFGKAIVRSLLAVAVVYCAVVAQADVFNMGGTRNPTTGTWTGLASLEMVTVANSGNAGEQSGLAYGDATYYGSVGYGYQIGKYEVTVAQYCQFLNAVARIDDPYYIFDNNMPAWSGIQQSGDVGNYSYSVVSGWANRPANIMLGSAAFRFCNWLTNGQPNTGVEDLSTTEDGSYYLNGEMWWDYPCPPLPTRKPGANYVLPTENEWYKAAYHKNDGVTDHYWDYPTHSDDVPSSVLSSTGTNNANYGDNQTDYTFLRLTEVGMLAGSPGPYGTFDQGGNIDEMTDTVYDPDDPGSMLRARGGARGGSANGMLASHYSWWYIDGASSNQGFRVACIPEPGSLAMLAGIALTASLYWWWKLT
jgi:formylglycine-generating enzyme